MRRSAFALITLFCAACFPIAQTARIDPGLRLDGGVTVIGDQTRHSTRQGTDFITYAVPSYGFGHRFEIGAPVGFYAEEGLSGSGWFGSDKNSFVVLPYLKLAMLDSHSPSHLALVTQAWLFVPANVGLRFSRDLGRWEPEASFTYIFAAGPAGDDPYITRYQERNQMMLSWSVGATIKGARRTTIEVGVLRNGYDEVTGFGQTGEIISRRTLYDVFVGMRVSVLGRR
ncbi:MAG TPA: hypothetical protein VE967_02880 [Gemmatimonadaceae bacterium]|nr:hypothetical protein [Gemmatimonadaceae bacterium]